MRTKEDVEKLKQGLETDLRTLPEYNGFGDSNEIDRKELKVMIWQCDLFLQDKSLPEDSEVNIWIQEKPSATIGNDYGI